MCISRAACVLVLASGCAPGRSFVEVVVRSDAGVADAYRFNVYVTVAGTSAQTISRDIPGAPLTIDRDNPQTFGLAFEASRRGALTVRVEALLMSGALAASGSAGGTLVPSHSQQLEIQLGVDPVGDGGAPPDDTGAPPGDTGPPMALWTQETSGVTRDLHGVFGVSPTSIYAVGDGGTVLRSVGNGVWNPQCASFSGVDLQSVWASSDSDVYAAGTRYIIRFPGACNWVVAYDTAAAATFYGLWGSGPGDVYAVGVSMTNLGMVYQGSAASWASQGISPAVYALRSVWGAGPSSIHAVGLTGTHISSAGGSSWIGQYGGVDLHAVFGTAPNNYYMVGGQGTIIHVVPGGQVTTQGMNIDFNGGFALPGRVYVVGARGTIWRSAGDDNWSVETAPVTSDLNAVWGAPGAGFYAVGAGGVILHTP
jgi:hypothetical protein